MIKAKTPSSLKGLMTQKTTKKNTIVYTIAYWIKWRPFDAIGDAIAENKKQQATKASNARASPPGVPPPPIVPVIEPATFGFVENAERQNSRASMIGWWSLLLVEAVAGKGLLEIAGFEVGKGINFTF